MDDTSILTLPSFTSYNKSPKKSKRSPINKVLHSSESEKSIRHACKVVSSNNIKGKRGFGKPKYSHLISKELKSRYNERMDRYLNTNTTISPSMLVEYEDEERTSSSPIPGSSKSPSLSPEKELQQQLYKSQKKTQQQETEPALWNNKTGRYAPTLNAEEAYLNCESNSSSMMAPAYYVKDLLIETAPPDAREHFKVNDETYRSSKRVSYMLSVNYSWRKASAAMIQKNYRFYRARMSWKKDYANQQMMANLLQFWFKKIHWRIKKRHAEKIVKKNAAITIQCLVRSILIKQKLKRREQKKYSSYANKIVVAMKAYLRWKRELKRIRKRQMRVIVRAQCAVRRFLLRCRLHYKRVIINYISAWWATRWMSKYGNYARIFLTKLRNAILKSKVIKMQSIARMYLGARSCARQKLLHLSYERTRLHGEVDILDFALRNIDITGEAVCGWKWNVKQTIDASTPLTSPHTPPSPKSSPASTPSSSPSKSPKGKKINSKASKSPKSTPSSSPVKGGVEKIPSDYSEEYKKLNDISSNVIKKHSNSNHLQKLLGTDLTHIYSNLNTFSERLCFSLLICFASATTKTSNDGLMDIGAMEFLFNYLHAVRPAVLVEEEEKEKVKKNIKKKVDVKIVNENEEVEMYRDEAKDKYEDDDKCDFYKNNDENNNSHTTENITTANNNYNDNETESSSISGSNNHNHEVKEIHVDVYADTDNIKTNNDNDKEMDDLEKETEVVVDVEVDKKDDISEISNDDDKKGDDSKSSKSGGSKASTPTKGSTPTKAFTPTKDTTPTKNTTPTKDTTPTKNTTPTKDTTPIEEIALAPVPTPVPDTSPVLRLGDRFSAETSTHFTFHIAEVVHACIPQRRLSFRTMIWGNLPKEILHTAVYYRQYLRYLMGYLQIVQEEYRRSCPPRRMCLKCKQSFAIDSDLARHLNNDHSDGKDKCYGEYGILRRLTRKHYLSHIERVLNGLNEKKEYKII